MATAKPRAKAAPALVPRIRIRPFARLPSWGTPEKVVLMLMPDQHEQDQLLIDQATRMVTEHPELVEIEQPTQGDRHLTVVHGEIEDPEHLPREFQTAGAVLSLLTGAPPPYYLGHGTDRLVLVVGGPQADRTVLTKVPRRTTSRSVRAAWSSAHRARTQPNRRSVGKKQRWDGPFVLGETPLG